MDRWPNKDPGDSRQYAIDCNPGLDGLPDGRTVASAPWTIPAGLPKVAEGLIDNVAVVRLSGGAAGVTYVCTCTATTSSGDIIGGTARLFINDK